MRSLISILIFLFSTSVFAADPAPVMRLDNSYANPAGGGSSQTMAVWSGYLAGQTNPNPLLMQQTGSYAGTAYTPYSFLLGGISPSTQYLSVHTDSKITQSLAAGVAIPSGSTQGEADGGYFYVTNNSTTTNAVGIGSITRALTSGTHLWGSNQVIDDNHFSTPTLIGNEYDIGCWNTGSSCYGLNIIGVFPNGVPTQAIGIEISRLSTYPWIFSFVSWDGSASNFALVGSQNNSANSDGQTIVFDARDGSNNIRQCTLQATHGSSTANLAVQCPTGGNFVVAGGEVITGAVALQNLIGLGRYTVSSLPVCNSIINVGNLAYVYDSVASPTWGSTATGGGSTVALVFCDGSGWKVH